MGDLGRDRVDAVATKALRRVFGTRQVVPKVATGICAGLGVILGEIYLLLPESARGAVRVASQGCEGGIEFLYGIYARTNEATILSEAAHAERQNNDAQYNEAAHSVVNAAMGWRCCCRGAHSRGDVPCFYIVTLPLAMSFSIRIYAPIESYLAGRLN